MKKKLPWSVAGAKEIYTNEKYKERVSLRSIIDPATQDLSNLLSIKAYTNGPLSKDYFIETKQYAHWITTQQWLDLYVGQFNKKTWEKGVYSPYSSPGYGFFAALVVGQHHFFQSSPPTTFTECNIDERNKRRENMERILGGSFLHLPTHYHLWPYLNLPEQFAKDTNGVYRFFWPKDTEDGARTDEWLWFTDNELIFRAVARQPWHEAKELTEIVIDKNLIPLYMQVYIDTNRITSGAVANLNVKRIQQCLFELLQLPAAEREKYEWVEKMYREKLT